jgi:cycloeucalenol cycloisomerase
MTKSAHWLSQVASRREGEVFFLIWTVLWISIVAAIVFFRWFEWFTSWHYLTVGLVICVPCIFGPLILPLSKSESTLDWSQRFSTKANVWCFIMAFVSNYLWTHYFYRVLGASYTFTAHRLNDVPFCLYLITHSYFITYHVGSSILLRRCGFKLPQWSSPLFWSIILGMAYFTAFAETYTIKNFPYYTFQDEQAMYRVGLGFYAIYFVVSYPMFLRLDQDGSRWTLSRTVIDSFACCMMITLLLDFWRLAIGPIFEMELVKPAVVPFVF